MAGEKQYITYDGTTLMGDSLEYMEAVIQARDLEQPIITCIIDSAETFRTYLENGIWWQSYSDARRRTRDVSRQMTRLFQRVEGLEHWTA